jgi:hypothetical protein
MSLSLLFSDLSTYLRSPEFRETARHPLHPNAFSRKRKLPLPTLVTLLLTGMKKSVQAELDEFFAHLNQQAQLVHHVTAQAFSLARDKLSVGTIPLLNDWVVRRAEHYGFVSLWNGLRPVAADASKVRFGLRASHVKRAALADQILFGMFIPGSELMLAAALYSSHEGERQMLFEHLDRLSSCDLLLLDRGYPCRWLVGVLNKRGLSFCMRAEKSGDNGFKCVQAFLRSGLSEQIVTLPAASTQDVLDFECPSEPQQVRLIRHIASTGEIRVLMTNLFDVVKFPASQFADLYHTRWRIEEAFKRLKHRLNIEHVSGLSQQDAAQDIAAKVLCDNLQALTALTASKDAKLPATKRINHAYAFTALKPLLPALLLGKKVAKLLRNVLNLIAKQTYIHIDSLSKPRNFGRKPHKHMAQKNC